MPNVVAAAGYHGQPYQKRLIGVNFVGFRNFHCTLTDAPLQDQLILCAILLLFWPLLFLLPIPTRFILNTRGDT